MASLRQIRSRIKSIQSSQQIMRAMQLVSASKFKRSQDQLSRSRAVMEFLDGLLSRVLATVPDLKHPLCADRPEGVTTLVVFTSDAGLCGAYNTNLIQLAEAHLRRDSLRQTQLVFIGKKAHRYFTKRGYRADDAYLDLAGRPNLAKAETIGRALLEQFLAGRSRAVHLLYAQFRSSSVSHPTIAQWLPIQLPDAGASGPRGIGSFDYIFEPSAEQVFERLLPRWAVARFQRVMLEAFTAEHSARMIAMKNATDNAQELLGALTTQRNKIRQAAITKELSEIVGTAEALK